MKTFPFKIVKVADSKKCAEKIKALESNIEKATHFIQSIEEGNLDADIDIDSASVEKDSLTGSLISMRNQMKVISEQEKERNWVTEGLAKFVEILRSNNDNLSSLSDKILSNLVKYLNANQGYLFILNQNDGERTLDLSACFAYNKKKYLNKQLQIGEGLVGQCFLEKETIYLTDIPDQYVKITSGIGESLPKNVIIVPLKINDEVFGIVEMASFNYIKKYQIEFLEKLGESIASTIANAKVAERTQKLLTEAQMMAEQLRSQEEEMRQNMEELSATQEEMERRQKEIDEANVRFDLVNKSSSEGLWEIKHLEEYENLAKEERPMWFSDQMCKLMGYNKGEIKELSGTLFNLIHPEDISSMVESFQAHIQDISGKTLYNIDYRIRTRNGEYRWFNSRGTTLRDNTGMPIRTAGALKDIHDERVAKETVEKILNEVQNKEQYLNNIINATSDSIVTLNENYLIETFNDVFKNSFSQMGFDIKKGMNILSMFSEDQKEMYVGYYKRAFAGESFEILTEYSGFYFTIYYAPIKDINQKIIGISIFSKNVTEQQTAKLETEKLLNDQKQLTEELRAQEEELRQNMEELTATQDELERRAAEVEVIRRSEKERADNQINSQKKIMEQFMLKAKQKEEDLLLKIKELESRLVDQLVN